MKIIHCLENGFWTEKEKNIGEDPSFLLTDSAGGYLWLAKKPSSRYQGWFFNFPGLIGRSVCKAVDEIKIVGAPEDVSEIKNNFWSAERKRGEYRESFFLPKGYNSLAYEVDREAELELFLDAREFGDYADTGRCYKISSEKGITFISYSRAGASVPKIFIAIKTDGKTEGKPEEWIKREYDYDRNRNSPPSVLYVFKALRLRARKIVFSASDKKSEAARNVEFVFNCLEDLKRERREEEKEVFLRISSRGQERGRGIFCAESTALRFCAEKSLRSLLVFNKEKEAFSGLFAGLPWFFQFWLRDESVCLKSLAACEKKAAADILTARIAEAERSGWKSGSADAPGWLLFRLGEEALRRSYTDSERRGMAEILERAACVLVKDFENSGFFLNGPKGTWMDSLDRSGARLEIQALYAAVFKFASALAKLPAQKEYFKEAEKKLAERTRKIFWNGSLLADGFDPQSQKIDASVRPNIFLAAYLYPDLLAAEEWKKCFDNALLRLWCDWGGLSSVDKNEHVFSAEYTGEDPASYHNGDSWFYVNNIAAIAMQRLDPYHFAFCISKIFEASSADILWKGMAGNPSELSPAARLFPAGCPCQAWSAATFLELLDEMGRRFETGCLTKNSGRFNINLQN